MVILENILNNLQPMGPAFWVGASAIALGATLLVISVLTMLRGIKFSTLRISNPLKMRIAHRGKVSGSGGRTTSSGMAKKTPSGYEPNAFPVQNKELRPTAASSLVPYELTDRLHRAADTLEEIIQGLRTENQASGFSPLKDDPEGVEYLFKTTVG